jgi:hypothetical protein
LVIRERHFAAGHLSSFDGLRHLAERARGGATNNLCVAGLTGDITKLPEGDLVLKDSLIRYGVYDGHNDRLGVQEHLRVVLVRL